MLRSILILLGLLYVSPIYAQLVTTTNLHPAGGNINCNTTANGTADDTATLNACIAQAITAGGNKTIMLPQGDTTITAASQITAGNVWLACGGSPGTCNIKASSNNALSWGVVTGGGTYNLGFKNSGATTNNMVLLSGGGNFQMLNPVMDPTIGGLITADTAQNGILVENAVGQVNNAATCLFTMKSGSGFFLKNPHLYTTASPGSATAGRDAVCFNTGSWDTFQQVGGALQNFDHPLNVNAAAAQTICCFKAEGPVIWDHHNSGPVFNAAATGTVSNISLGTAWISSSTGNCMDVTGAGSHEIYNLNGMHFPQCQQSGLSVTATGAVKGFSIVGASMQGVNHGASGTRYGTYFAGGATYSYITISNSQIGVNHSAIDAGQPTYGCYYAAAIDNGIFSGNNCQGATAGYQGMGAGTSTTYAHTNFKQTGNVGLIDWPGAIVLSKVVNTTYDLTTASGNQVISGFGFTPSTCDIFATTSGGSLIYTTVNGHVDSALTQAVVYGGSATAISYQPGLFVGAVDATGTSFQFGAVSAFGSGSVTIAWTKTGTPTGTLNESVRCFQ